MPHSPNDGGLVVERTWKLVELVEVEWNGSLMNIEGDTPVSELRNEITACSLRRAVGHIEIRFPVPDKNKLRSIGDRLFQLQS